MAVATDAQKLDIQPAVVFDPAVKVSGVRRDEQLRNGAVEQMGAVRRDVDVAEQVFVHVEVIAARVQRAHRVVFVEVVRRDVFERERSRRDGASRARRRRPLGSSRSASPGRLARARGVPARSLRPATRRRPARRPGRRERPGPRLPRGGRAVSRSHRHRDSSTIVKAGRRPESRRAQRLRSCRRPGPSSPSQPESSWPPRMPSASWMGSAGQDAAARGS